MSAMRRDFGCVQPARKRHPCAVSDRQQHAHKRHSQIESGRCRKGLIENGRERQKTHSCHCRIRSPRLQYALHSGVGGRPESTHGCRLQISTQETVVSSIADVPARGIRRALHRETADGRKAPATVVARELVDGLRSKSASRAIDRKTAPICAQRGCAGCNSTAYCARPPVSTLHPAATWLHATFPEIRELKSALKVLSPADKEYILVTNPSNAE